MNDLISWAKAISTTVAAAGAVGVAATLPDGSRWAIVWTIVFFAGSIPRLAADLVVPEPGLQWSWRPPFVRFRRLPSDDGAPGLLPLVVTRVSGVVLVAALAAYLLQDLLDRL